ncbi:MAG: DUF1194 domain-containing protein [Pseudomonadota bacterium]
MKHLLLALFLTLAALPGPAAAQGQFCKLALALGLDISSSVNAAEYRLQLEGLASALETNEVIEAILLPHGAHIQVTVYEWSGYQQQDIIIGWTKLDSPERIRDFAARLRSHRRLYAEFATALGKGVEFGARLFSSAPPCGRQVLDISGDGANNDGVGPDYFRERGLLDGIVINGLVILGAVPDPALYYRRHVMQGPESFVALARSFEDYKDVMVGKLLREINTEMILGLAR